MRIPFIVILVFFYLFMFTLRYALVIPTLMRLYEKYVMATLWKTMMGAFAVVKPELTYH
jgi:hypothetical protein